MWRHRLSAMSWSVLVDRSKACAAHRATRPLTTNSNVALSSRPRHHSAKCMMRNQACRINSRLEPTGRTPARACRLTLQVECRSREALLYLVRLPGVGLKVS